MMSTLHKILSYLEKPKPTTSKEYHIFGDMDIHFKTMEKYEEFKRECGVPESEDIYGDETSKEVWKTCEGIIDGFEIDAFSPHIPNPKYDLSAEKKIQKEWGAYLEPYDRDKHKVTDDNDLLTLWRFTTRNKEVVVDVYTLGVLSIGVVTGKNGVPCNIPMIKFSYSTRPEAAVINVEMSWKRLKQLHKEIWHILKREKVN